MRVLLVGHACSPCVGSEPSFTWNWALQLSQRHRVWVLAHPYDRAAVERFLADHQNPNLEFHWVTLPPWLDPWNPHGTGGGLRLHYLFWLRCAHKKAIELHQRVGFDIVHHVSYGTISAPPPFWKLPIPFVWGPVGGAQRVPSSFRDYFGYVSGREILRRARVATLPLSFSLRRAVRSSALLLATNHETGRLLSRAGGRNVRLFLDSGIPSNFLLNSGFPRPKTMPFTLLWVGRMEPRKALPLALEALAETKNLNVKMLIAGDGTMRQPWESYAKNLNLRANVEFLGQVPWNQMSRFYQSADAFLFTSLRDSFGTQVLEAMAHALPILTLDHQGVGTFVPSDAGIKVAVTSPQQTVKELADGIRRLALSPDERLKMGEAAQDFAKTQTWEKRAERMSQIYEEVLRRPVCAKAKSFSFQGGKATRAV